MRRILLLTIAALAVAPTGAIGQQTSTAVDRAVEALARDPVYVDPDADPGLSDAEAERVRRAIERADAGPLYVAIMPRAAARATGGDVSELARRIANTLRREGTYVVAAGDRLRAGSTELPRGRAGEIAREAIDARRGEGLAAILVDLVGRVERARSGGGGDKGGGGGGGGSGFFLLLILALPLAMFAFARTRRRRREREDLADVREAAREDTVALGEEIRALDLDIEMPGVDSAAREEYGRALAAYERASSLVDRARRPEDFAQVASAAEEGRYAIAATRARLEGREPPERRAPCFFDPRHGPSVREVEWAPPGGSPRLVPACAADALEVEEGRDPAMREVVAGGVSTPYWAAGPAFGPWAGGFFGGFGGFFPGLFLGSMVGGSMFGGLANAHASDGGGDGGDFGGDFGGFGGGDFGGGDFGGGGDF